MDSHINKFEPAANFSIVFPMYPVSPLYTRDLSCSWIFIEYDGILWGLFEKDIFVFPIVILSVSEYKCISKYCSSPKLVINW